MNGSSLAPAFTTCPSCGLPLRPRAAVCPSCGTLPVLERLPLRILGWIKRRSRLWHARADHLTLIVWGLALAPCLIAPPLIAIGLAWRNGLGEDERRDDATFITIVACLNIVLSVVLIMRFGHEVLAAVETWRHLWQTEPAATQRLTPI